MSCYRPTLLAALLIGTTLPLLPTLTGPAFAQTAGQEFSLSIPAQPLPQALAALADRTGLQVFYSSEAAYDLRSNAVNGTYSADQALSQMLAGTGATARRVGQNGVTISVAGEPAAAGAMVAPEGSIMLDTISIQASGLSTERSGSYSTGAASIAGGAESLKEVPQSVTVLTQEVLQDQNLTMMSDAMRKTTGIVVTQGQGGETSFYSRGFQIKNYQIDGLGTSYDSTYTPDFDLVMYDRLEVLRGAEGLFSAAGEPGGTLNLARKRPTDFLQSSVALTGGSWNHRRIEADISGPIALDGALRGRLIGAWQDREFFYKPSDEEKQVLYGVLEYDLTPSTVLSAGLSYQHLSGNRWQGGLPTYIDGTHVDVPRDVALTVDWARRNENIREVFTSIEHEFNPDWKLKASAMRQRYEFDYLRLGTPGPIDPVTGSFGQPSMSSEADGNNSNVFDVNVTGRFDAWGREYKLVAGVDWRRSYGKQLRYNVSPNQLPGDFGIGDFPGLELPEPTIGTLNHGWPAWGGKQQGLYGRLDMEVTDKMHVIVGGRYGNYKHSETYLRFDEDGNVSERDTSWTWREDGIFTPYAGITYDLTPDWTAYASLTEIYKPQGNIFAGPPENPTQLDPITGRNFELGAKGSVMGGALNVAAAVYRIERKGEAVEDARYEDEDRTYYIPLGEIVSQGVDLEVSGEISPGWQVFAGYTYNRNENKSDGDVYHARTPRHVFKLWTDYNLPGQYDKWSVGGGVTVKSKHANSGTYWLRGPDGWLQPEFRIEQGGYAVWDANVQYRIDDQWLMSLNVNNLFDKNYYSTVGTPGGGNWYGEPRSVALTLRGQF